MKRILIALGTLLLGAGSSLAQTTFATITGTVTDATGASVVGAKVEGVQTESGYKYDAQSNESGLFTLANLREGAYDVKVIAPGFKEFRVQGLTLVSREIRRL